VLVNLFFAKIMNLKAIISILGITHIRIENFIRGMGGGGRPSENGHNGVSRFVRKGERG